jgi:hypothetical protein
MLRVKTQVQPSSIHGLGLFAGEPLPKGTLIWEFDWTFDVFIADGYLSKLPPQAQEWFRKVAWKKGNVWFACCDTASFVNHSDAPNIGGYPQVVALRDIVQGEELTEDYTLYDDASAPGCFTP